MTDRTALVQYHLEQMRLRGFVGCVAPTDMDDETERYFQTPEEARGWREQVAERRALRDHMTMLYWSRPLHAA